MSSAREMRGTPGRGARAHHRRQPWHSERFQHGGASVEHESGSERLKRVSLRASIEPIATQARREPRSIPKPHRACRPKRTDVVDVEIGHTHGPTSLASKRMPSASEVISRESASPEATSRSARAVVRPNSSALRAEGFADVSTRGSRGFLRHADKHRTSGISVLSKRHPEDATPQYAPIDDGYR